MRPPAVGSQPCRSRDLRDEDRSAPSLAGLRSGIVRRRLLGGAPRAAGRRLSRASRRRHRDPRGTGRRAGVVDLRGTGNGRRGNGIGRADQPRGGLRHRSRPAPAHRGRRRACERAPLGPDVPVHGPRSQGCRDVRDQCGGHRDVGSQGPHREPPGPSPAWRADATGHSRVRQRSRVLARARPDCRHGPTVRRGRLHRHEVVLPLGPRGRRARDGGERGGRRSRRGRPWARASRS